MPIFSPSLVLPLPAALNNGGIKDLSLTNILLAGFKTFCPTNLNVGATTFLVVPFITGAKTYLPPTVKPPTNAAPSVPYFNLFIKVAAAFSLPLIPVVSFNLSLSEPIPNG